jgi:hypothetical protein
VKNLIESILNVSAFALIIFLGSIGGRRERLGQRGHRMQGQDDWGWACT